MNNNDTNLAQNFFTAMSTEAHKVMEMFAGKVGEEYLDDLNVAWKELLERPHDQQGWINAFAEYQKTSMAFWSSMFASAQPKTSAAPTDRRFSSEEWTSNPVFNYIKESYLVASNMLTKMVSDTPLDEKSQARLKFYTQQYIDALSPTNFAATNPEVIQQAIETKGQSLIDGMQNLLGDVEKGRITMTDETAFSLGENIAVTPGSVIFQNEIMQIIHYQPQAEKVNERPTLIVPPCINKFYILDLQPGNSFVKYALEQGQNLFLISWVNATKEQAEISWDDYVETGVLKALDVVKEISGADRVNTVGWCVGGTILASSLAVLNARKDNTVASATFLTTLLNFEEPGDLGIFLDQKQVGPLLNKVKSEGILSGKSLSTTFNMLRSNDLIWSYVVTNYLKGQAPAPFDILYWNSDPTNLPAEMYCYYISNMYVDNKLCEPGALTICGESIDLTKVKTPCYFLSCMEDHIAPWKTTYLGTDLFGNHEFVLGASGHIAGVINPAAKNRRNYWINGKTDGDADAWLESAERHEGSWWPHWAAWLKKRGGKQVDAPEKVGNAKYKALEPAPGSFVKVRIN